MSEVPDISKKVILPPAFNYKLHRLHALHVPFPVHHSSGINLAFWRLHWRARTAPELLQFVLSTKIPHLLLPLQWLIWHTDIMRQMKDTSFTNMEKSLLPLLFQSVHIFLSLLLSSWFLPGDSWKIPSAARASCINRLYSLKGNSRYLGRSKGKQGYRWPLGESCPKGKKFFDLRQAETRTDSWQRGHGYYKLV